MGILLFIDWVWAGVSFEILLVCVVVRLLVVVNFKNWEPLGSKVCVR